MRQAPTRISARKILIWAPGTIKVAAWTDIEDFTADSEVYLGIFQAVVWFEGERCEGLEDDGGGGSGERSKCFGFKLVVGDVEEEGEEDAVDWGEDGGHLWGWAGRFCVHSALCVLHLGRLYEWFSVGETSRLMAEV